MKKFMLKICYDGTNYCGWQVQPNGISVQQVLGDALSDLLGERTGITGCSRTDSGVHANEFCCHFSTENDTVTEKGYVGGLNARLPDDISVFCCFEVDADFHARYSAGRKQYIYKIYCSEARNPFLDKYALRISKPLDLERVEAFCKSLVGRHDFCAFSSAGRSAGTTERTVFDCGIEQCGNMYTFYITGDGFLYNMVRILVGTALFVSGGKLCPDCFYAISAAGQRSLAGPTAPPHGLYLNKVFYAKGDIRHGI